MSDPIEPSGPESGNGAGAPVGEYRIQVIGQYVKDLSFENPGAPGSFAERPKIDLGVDLQARRVEANNFEVEIKLRVHATNEDKTLFLMELAYAGLFALENIPDDILQQVLLIEAPHLLFPFARRIVADCIRDGGMPPMMIEPIDFAGLYRAKMNEAMARPGAMPV
jgi:preprotein translocase subunit SecB